MLRSNACRSAAAFGLAAGLAVGLVGLVGVAGSAGAVTRGPTVPGKPIAVVVTPANMALSVSWGVPTTNGGASITGYTATATSKGRLVTESCTTTVAPYCVISGIVNPAGKAKNKYKVSVTATNSLGTGRAGKASGTFTGTAAQNCSQFGKYANLQGCDLSGANLSGVDLTGSNLTNSNLTNTDLDYAVLTDANLTGATLIGNVLNYTHWEVTTCPDGSVTSASCGGIPDAPTNVSVNYCNGPTCSLYWTIPAGNGTALTEYVVHDSVGSQVVGSESVVVGVGVPAGAAGSMASIQFNESSACVSFRSCSVQISASNNFGQGAFGTSFQF